MPAVADNIEGRTGIGGQLGIQKLVGGNHDYSNVDQNFGLWLRHGFSPVWSLEVGANYGWVRPGALQGQDAGFTFESVHAFYTTMISGFAGARYHFAPEKRFGPYAGAHLGLMSWQVRDENRGGFGFFPGGPTVAGYDKNGNPADLEGTDLTGTFSLGAEYFLTESLSLDLGARYTLIFGNDKDNIGSSALWGPTEADVNGGRWDMFVGGTLYFGGSHDRDRDGIEDKFDGCPDAAEDYDGYRDQDGCPDLDNDDDGIADADDLCPDDAEDLDGYRDEDGCPDPDNDGDGVIDSNDNCPDTPAGVAVGPDGCPSAAEIKAKAVLEGVSFGHNSAELASASFAALDKLAETLAAYPQVNVEIRGHTDSSGSATYNLDISSRRAAAVREYLVGRGIAADRITAVGYGEDLPLVDNGTSEGRATNRRVEMVRTR